MLPIQIYNKLESDYANDIWECRTNAILLLISVYMAYILYISSSFLRGHDEHQ